MLIWGSTPDEVLLQSWKAMTPSSCLKVPFTKRAPPCKGAARVKTWGSQPDREKGMPGHDMVDLNVTE